MDLGLVIPDDRRPLRNGAIKPMQTPGVEGLPGTICLYAGEAGIPRDTPWKDLCRAPQVGHRRHAQLERQLEQAVVGQASSTTWRAKAYKMHIRVLLSKYRSYTECPAAGARGSKTEALLWRVGSRRRPMPPLPASRNVPSRSALPGTATN